MNAKVKALVTALGGIPEKLVNGIVVFIDGIIKQFSTLKGACMALLGLAIVIDLLTMGKLGFIAFVVAMGNKIVVTALEAIAGKWLELIMIGVLIIIAKK